MPPRPNTESRGRDNRGREARSGTVLTTVGGTQGCLLPGNECPVSSSPPKPQTFVYTEGYWHMGGVPGQGRRAWGGRIGRFGSPPLPCGGGPKRPFRRVPRRGRTPGPNDAGGAVNLVPLSGSGGWTRRVGCGGCVAGAAGASLRAPKRCHQGRAPPSAVAWWWPHRLGGGSNRAASELAGGFAPPSRFRSASPRPKTQKDPDP